MICIDDYISFTYAKPLYIVFNQVYDMKEV
jgi:hypothetical protein